MPEVLEISTMVDRDLLDVRAITMGLSLLDCIGSDKTKPNRNIYELICRRAGKLVGTDEAISREYGIPIVNKRVSVAPIALIGGTTCRATKDFVQIAETLGRTAKGIGVNFIGGYSALVTKGVTDAEHLLIGSIPEVLVRTEHVYSSVSVGSMRTRLNVDVVRRMEQVVKETAEGTAGDDSLSYARLVIFCNTPDDNPFMAGTFHGVTEGDAAIRVGVSGPGVVRAAVQQAKGQSFEVLYETIKRTAFETTRVGQLVAKEASRRLDTPFGTTDLSLTPIPAADDLVADILGGIGFESVGAPGTTAALTLLNDQVKKGGVIASSYVGDLPGALISVGEDQGMIRVAERGALTLEKFEAITCVRSVGPGMITVPGDTSAEAISGIAADEAVVGMINQGITAVRLIPAAGKKVGDEMEFDGLLGHMPVIAVNPYSCADLVKREGRIPTSVHFFKN